MVPREPRQCGSAGPEDRHVVSPENRVCGHESKPFYLGLGYQDSVERVPMVHRQLLDLEYVILQDRKALVPESLKPVRYVLRCGKRDGQLAQSRLDDDFPGAAGGEKDLVPSLSQSIPCGSV